MSYFYPIFVFFNMLTSNSSGVECAASEKIHGATIDVSMFILYKYTFLYHSNRLLKSYFLIMVRKGGYVEVRKKGLTNWFEFVFEQKCYTSNSECAVWMCVCVCMSVQDGSAAGNSAGPCGGRLCPRNLFPLKLMLISGGRSDRDRSQSCCCVWALELFSSHFPHWGQTLQAETSACACEGRPFQMQQLTTS